MFGQMKDFDNPKLKKDDRILVLGPIEGKRAISSKGLFDPRLFSGENELHAVKDAQGTLWRMRYKMGGIPDELRQAFTSFERLHDFAKVYYAKRNIEIKEVID